MSTLTPSELARSVIPLVLEYCKEEQRKAKSELHASFFDQHTALQLRETRTIRACRVNRTKHACQDDVHYSCMHALVMSIGDIPRLHQQIAKLRQELEQEDVLVSSTRWLHIQKSWISVWSKREEAWEWVMGLADHYCYGGSIDSDPVVFRAAADLCVLACQLMLDIRAGVKAMRDNRAAYEKVWSTYKLESRIV